MTPTGETASDSDFVQSLARGLRVIRAFDAEHPVLSLSEVARRADIPAAAARRFLRTLATLGYVRLRGREFSLTPRVLELGFSYLSALSLPQVVQPHLERLSEELEESVSAAVLSDADITYIARVSTRRIMTVGITIGTRFPAYATSMGRVLLANLPEEECAALLRMTEPQALTNATLTDAQIIHSELSRVRAEGWAVVNGELEEGLCSAAVPVVGKHGDVVCAINVSTTTSRHDPEWVRDFFVPELERTADRIEQELRLL